MKTTDGGLIWYQENMQTQTGFSSVYFADNATGWVAGYGGAILKFGDGINSGNLAHNNLNLSITDFNTTEDIIFAYYQKEYLNYYKLVDVEVLLDTISHSSDSDLIITLSHLGITDTLVNRRGGDGDNFINTRLFDASTNPISSGSAPFTGDFKPDIPIKSFLGLDPNGEWKLSIYDDAAGNTGVLQAWGLKLYFTGFTGIKYEPEIFSRLITLSANYPNPFDKITKIKWKLSVSANVVLKVYDFLGREIKTMVDEYQTPGDHESFFNADGLTTGVYFYQIQVDGIIQTKKMVLIQNNN
jgi:hypothetical protein